MEERDKHIDAYFASMGSYTEQPPAEVWNALEQRLNKPRKKYAIWWWVCLVVGLAGLGGGAILYANRTQPDKATAKETENTLYKRAYIIEENKKTTTTNNSQKIVKEINEHPITAPEQPKQARHKAPANPIPAIAKETEQPHTTQQPVPIQPQAVVDEPATISETQLAQNSGTKPVKQPEAPQKAATAQPATKPGKEDYLALTPMAGKEQQPTEKRTTEQYIALLPQTGKAALATQPIAPLEVKQAELPAPRKMEIAAMQPISSKALNVLQSKTKPAEIAQAGVTQVAYTVPQQNMVDDTETPKKKKRTEAGIKIGYENGTSSYNISGLVLMPYAKFPFNDRWSFMLQPVLKYGSMSKYILADRSYYRVWETRRELLPLWSNNPYVGNVPRFEYTEVYDSIQITNYASQKAFFTMDFPLMLSYQLRPHITVYGGPNINFTNFGLRMDEKYFTKTRKDTVDAIVVTNPNPITSTNSYSLDTLSPEDVFTHSNPHFSQYNHMQYMQGSSVLRVGVTFGISYAYRERLLFDLRYRQNVTGLKSEPSPVIRRVHGQPYFSITAGYRIFK